MKAGDKVTIRDGSWAKKTENGRLISASVNRPEIRGQHWTVVETGCVFPLEQNYGQPPRYRNDTVIQGPDGVDDVIFIHSGFLKLVPPSPPPPPPHVWVHGDVFSNHVYGAFVYLEPANGPICVNLLATGGGGTVAMQLRSDAKPKFLFNIKDALSDRGIV